ncbi:MULTISPECIES: SLC13 family permease [Sphingomonadales]|uniref:SLC13 family permease n=1 Tax=Sphingomonadales TaxID=204457 RepID=UPI0012EB0B31|nr:MULTISPECIES: SLC13 family permease [Sphingomonadaceae]MBD3765852.1 C4-dicarboxylate ABC transporter [Rhodobacterales bacterium]MDQ4422197.1 SLC13 family permease [Sphingobium sp. DEHP117]
MSIHVIGIAALVLVFVVGTLRPVNLGVLCLVATYLVGSLVAGENSRELLSGFPADLFVLLVGVTYLFGIASSNGTIQWLVERAAQLLGDRPGAVPWLIFGVAAIPSAAGALGPAAVAMLAPLCLNLGERYHIDRRMSALMLMHGSALGNFSPLNGLAIIVKAAAEVGGLHFSSAQLFFSNAAYNIALAVVIYLLFGGPALLLRRRAVVAVGPAPVVADLGASAVLLAREQEEVGPAGSTEALVASEDVALRPDQMVTLAAILGVGTGALIYDIDIGFLALLAASFLHLCFPSRVALADRRIVWSVVLLICGVVTFVSALQRFGTITEIGGGIAEAGAPLLVAFLLCMVGAVSSAVGSSAGLLGVLIPLAVPLLSQGEVGITGMIVALSISATVVDSTPFSTVGALTLANAPEEERPALFRAMLIWGLAMILTAPALTWLLFIRAGTG